MADDKSHVKVLFSCTPGFEKLCEAEISEKVSSKVAKESRGRVVASVSDLPSLDNLRSVHHYYVIARDTEYTWLEAENKDEILSKLETVAAETAWDDVLYAWRCYRRTISQKNGDKDPLDRPNTESVDKPTSEIDCDSASSPRNSCFEANKLKFRVTTSRIGKHCFTSPDVSRYIGSGVKERFGWDVDLENYDINVQVFVSGVKLILTLQLTEESKHKRNVSRFGPTTLMATIAYCILKLAEPRAGDIICDPMCGSGSVPLEGVHSFPWTFQLGGEIHSEGCLRSEENFRNYSAFRDKDCASASCSYSAPYNIIQWDTCSLPLRTGSVDVIVCDLPFGKKMGHRTKNWSLYTSSLREMARVCKTKEGRAVLITQHKEAFNRALKLCHHLWKKKQLYHISMGGLNVGVYVLTRTFNIPKDDGV